MDQVWNPEVLRRVQSTILILHAILVLSILILGYWYYSIFVIIFAWYTFITYGEMYYKSLSLYVKNSKKILLCEKNVIDENGIFAFLKKMALQNYFILYLLLAYFLSKMMSEKIGGHHASFSITRGYLRVNFVRMCYHGMT